MGAVAVRGQRGVRFRHGHGYPPAAGLQARRMGVGGDLGGEGLGRPPVSFPGASTVGSCPSQTQSGPQSQRRFGGGWRDHHGTRLQNNPEKRGKLRQRSKAVPSAMPEITAGVNSKPKAKGNGTHPSTRQGPDPKSRPQEREPQCMSGSFFLNAHKSPRTPPPNTSALFLSHSFIHVFIRLKGPGGGWRFLFSRSPGAAAEAEGGRGEGAGDGDAEGPQDQLRGLAHQL